MVWPITEDIKTSDHWPITKDKARFQGDGVAVVVAESRGLADDAAEVVAVEYEQLTPVLDLEEAAKDGSPLVHDELGTNAVVHWSHGGGGDQGVFDSAPVQLRLRYEAPRITPSPIEAAGRSLPSVPAMGEFTLWTSTQIPHIARVTLSGTTGIPEHKLRIVAPDVGGAFGAKLNVYAEEALCLALARRTGRAVKWIEDRSESYAVTAHGPRGDPRRRGGGDRGGEDPRVPGEGAGRHGRVFPAAHAGDPRARRLGLHGPVRHAGATGTSSPAS